MNRRRGCLSPSHRLLSPYCKASGVQTYGCLPGHRASLLIGQYQIISCVSGLLDGAVDESRNRDLLMLSPPQ